MMCKDKKGLKDKDYYDSKSIIHQFCDQFDMLEWMNENYQSAQVNEEFICIFQFFIYLHIKMHVLTTKQCCDLLNWVSVIHNSVICMNDSNYAWRE